MTPHPRPQPCFTSLAPRLCCSWAPVGGFGAASPSVVGWPAFAASADGDLYFAFSDVDAAAGLSGGLTVSKWGGAARGWAPLGGNRSVSAGQASRIALALANGDSTTVFAAYADGAAGGNVSVIAYTDLGGWVPFGVALGGPQVTSLSLAVDQQGLPWVVSAQPSGHYRSASCASDAQRPPVPAFSAAAPASPLHPPSAIAAAAQVPGAVAACRAR